MRVAAGGGSRVGRGARCGAKAHTHPDDDDDDDEGGKEDTYLYPTPPCLTPLLGLAVLVLLVPNLFMVVVLLVIILLIVPCDVSLSSGVKLPVVSFPCASAIS